MRAKAVIDGNLFNIPEPPFNAMGGRKRLGRPGVGCPGEVCRFRSLANPGSFKTEARDHRSLLREATDTMFPRKASKLQLNGDRTVNGHTWVG